MLPREELLTVGMEERLEREEEDVVGREEREEVPTRTPREVTVREGTRTLVASVATRVLLSIRLERKPDMADERLTVLVEVRPPLTLLPPARPDPAR